VLSSQAMDRLGAVAGLLLLLLAPALCLPQAGAADCWPTVHGDNRRSGSYKSFPRGPLELAWRKELYRELTSARAEVIVAEGLAFQGTLSGKLYAWDALDGEERWVFESGGAIGHSPAYAGGLIYLASLDRNLYALEAKSGKERWRFRADEGLWAAPMVEGDAVFFGSRGGTFYALERQSGKPRWTSSTGGMILAPASAADGRVVFTSEEMRLYCLDLESGSLRWRSDKLPGLSLRDHAPVLWGDLVIVTSNPAFPFHEILDRQQEFLLAQARRDGWDGSGDRRYIRDDPAKHPLEQAAIVRYLEENPDERCFHVFRLADGSIPWTAPVFYTGGLHNPPAPPCFDSDERLYLFFRSAYTTWDGGGEVRPFTDVGRLDRRTGRITPIRHRYGAGRKTMPWGAFWTIGDETQSLSIASGRLICTHQGSIGQLDLASGELKNLFGKRDTYGGFYGPGTFGWSEQGGERRAEAAGEPFGLRNEWHGPARAIVSVAGGHIYYAPGSQVMALREKR
jgi:outer membrane protein assembly factor BamB